MNYKLFSTRSSKLNNSQIKAICFLKDENKLLWSVIPTAGILFFSHKFFVFTDSFRGLWCLHFPLISSHVISHGFRILEAEVMSLTPPLPPLKIIGLSIFVSISRIHSHYLNPNCTDYEFIESNGVYCCCSLLSKLDDALMKCLFFH